jgi:hypothetical protein
MKEGAQVTTMPAESGGKSWLKKISLAALRKNRWDPKQKRRLPEGKRRFCLIMTRKEELLCPWQAWQRPTLPGLEP